MTVPEECASRIIDKKLAHSDWIVQSHDEVIVVAEMEIRTRERVANKLQDRIQERSWATPQGRFGLWGSCNRNGSGSR